MSIPSHFNKETTGEEVAQTFADQIKGANVLISGCSPQGLGAEFARIVAHFEPNLLVIAGRKQEPLDQTKTTILSEVPTANIRTLLIDLADFASVRSAAAIITAYPSHEKLTVLVNNAGLMACPLTYLPSPASPPHIEAQFGTNHLGLFLFTGLVLSDLPKYSVRVVTLSSVGHKFQQFEGHEKGVNFANPGFLPPGVSGEEKGPYGEKGEYERWDAYAQAKTATVLFAGGLRRRGWEAVSLHPGAVRTPLQRHLSREDEIKADFIDESGAYTDTYFWKTMSQGVATHLTAAFAPWSALTASAEGKGEHDGIYLDDCQVSSAAEHAKGEEREARLWALSEEMVGESFDL